MDGLAIKENMKQPNGDPDLKIPNFHAAGVGEPTDKTKSLGYIPRGFTSGQPPKPQTSAIQQRSMMKLIKEENAEFTTGKGRESAEKRVKTNASQSSAR